MCAARVRASKTGVALRAAGPNRIIVGRGAEESRRASALASSARVTRTGSAGDACTCVGHAGPAASVPRHACAKEGVNVRGGARRIRAARVWAALVDVRLAVGAGVARIAHALPPRDLQFAKSSLEVAFGSVRGDGPGVHVFTFIFTN